MRPAPEAHRFQFWKRLLVLGCMGLALAAMWAASAECNASALHAMGVRESRNGLGLLTRLEEWETHFGPAETVEQADGGETFFFWPEHGISVFTHPHYEGQARNRSRGDLRVTSIIVPIQRTLHPQVPPVREGILVEYEKLLDLEIQGRSLLDWTAEDSVAGGARGGTGGEFLELQPGLCQILSGIRVRVYLAEDRPSELEIREARVFSWYD